MRTGSCRISCARRTNGFLAQAAARGFNPAYSAYVPGSQQLTVFPKLSEAAR